jgi:hypothetical protein
MPVLRRGRKGIASAFDVGACVAWLRRRDAARLAPLPKTHEKQTRASREELREILRGLWLPLSHLLPWHSGAPDVLPLREFEKEIGLDHEGGEFLDWIALGCPTLPPAPGETVLRVPRRHVELWRLLLGGLVETAGGDGLRLELGREMRRLCGLPLADDDEPLDDEGEEAEERASP